MKQVRIISSLITIACIFTVSVHAQTATPSATPTTGNDAAKLKQIEEIKQRVATKVAELSQSEKRAIYGTVTNTSISSITVDTNAKGIKIELTDSILVAQLLKGKRTKLTTDDVSKGDRITVFGDYDTTLDILKAKAIYIQSAPPTIISGVVTDIDKKNFTVTVTSQDQSYLVDIEKGTKILAWDSGKGQTKSGFSSVALQDHVNIVGTREKEQDTRISAVRFLIVHLASENNVVATPATQSATLSPTTQTSPTPLPTIKPTPTPTPKPTP